MGKATVKEFFVSYHRQTESSKIRRPLKLTFNIKRSLSLDQGRLLSLCESTCGRELPLRQTEELEILILLFCKALSSHLANSF